MARLFGRVSDPKSYSLRSLFIIINLTVLAIPVIGLLSVRLYENSLHRKTEENLFAQGLEVQRLYLAVLRNVTKDQGMDALPGRIIVNLPGNIGKILRPHLPKYDIYQQPVLPPAPDGSTPIGISNPTIIQAGDKIEPLLKEAQSRYLSAVRILDLNGIVVASTGSEKGLTLSNREEVREVLTGRYSVMLREIVGEEASLIIGAFNRASRIRVFVAMPVFDGNRLIGAVYLSRTSLSVTRTLWRIRYAFVLAVMLAGTVAISLVLSYIVTRPLKAMVRQAERVAAGEAGVSLDASAAAPKEAHQLSRAISVMLEKLERRLDYVREFSSSVSHEFKTPLTSIQGAIELLKDNWREMTDEDRVRFLDIIDAESRRMDRLVKRLIELTKIETADPTDETCDLKAILEILVRRYIEMGHNVTFEAKTDNTEARIAPDMAETLFVNLIENAVTHGKGSPVTVTMQSDHTITVKNSGPGISPANLERIFHRFFTTARDAGGTGLGLAMVKAIANSCGATIAVKSNSSETTFSVKFKPSSQPG